MFNFSKKEKFILSLILVGIILSGSFLTWKIYQKSKLKSNSNSASNSENLLNNISPPTVSPSPEESSLPVLSKPYYGVNDAGKKNQATKPTNQNSVQNQLNKESTPAANINSNNTNTNTANNNIKYTKTAIQNNNNQAAQPTTAFTFAVIGDSQQFDASNPNGDFQKAVNNISKANVDSVVIVGDLVSSCKGDNECTAKYDSWKKIMQPLLAKTKMAQGNHDRSGGDKADSIWQKEFELPTNGPSGYSELTYSYDVGNSHFVILDSEKPQENIVNQTQRDWLEQDLSSTSKENIFVFYHEPAYPVSSKIGESLDAKKTDRDALWQIFKKHNVTAVFNGHEHIISRKSIDGIYQFVFGNTDTFDHDSPKPGIAEYAYRGHAYGIVSVKDKEVTVKVYTTDGALLDTFTIPR